VFVFSVCQRPSIPLDILSASYTIHRNFSLGKHADTSVWLGVNNEACAPGKSSIAKFPALASYREYYRCRHCNHLTPKGNAKISGFDSEHSLRHVHCPSCGRIVAWPPEGSKIRSIAEGAFLTVAGGAMAILLYPSLNIYGLQLGFFASLFGVLKAVFL
jgi:ribosomal protein S27E